MALVALRPNQLIKLRGALCRLVGKVPGGKWHLIELASGLTDLQGEMELWRAFEKKELIFCTTQDAEPTRGAGMIEHLSGNAENAGLLNADDDHRREAEYRMQYVVATAHMSEASAKATIRTIHERLKWPDEPPSVRTVQRWRSRIDGADDPISALIARDCLKGNRDDRYDSAVMDVIRDVRDEKFLQSKYRVTETGAVEDIRDRIRLKNAQLPRCDQLRLPGIKAFRNVLGEIPEADRVSARFGSDAALARFRTSLGGIKVDRPLKRCEIDHTTLSIVLCDEDFVPWGRANASMAYDPSLGGITGMYVGPEVPSIVSVSRCMKSSIMPKFELLEQYPHVKGDWPFFGVHETYVVDNGLEEHASAMRQACWEMNAVLEFCPRKSPWMKPHIERHIRSQDVDLLHSLPGTTMENALKRCEFRPGKDLLLRRSTFDKILMTWVVDIHLRRGRTSRGNLSPVQIWKSKTEGMDIMVPSKMVLLERLFFRRVTDRQLDHEGVEYDCLVYNSIDMGLVRGAFGAVLTVDIWVSDEDLGYIYVEAPETDVWIKVPCLDQQYACGTTRWQHGKVKQMRRVASSDGEALEFAEARQRIQLLVDEDQREFKQCLRKRRSRFTEQGKASGAVDPVESQSASENGKEQDLEAAQRQLLLTVAPDFKVTRTERSP